MEKTIAGKGLEMVAHDSSSSNFFVKLGKKTFDLVVIFCFCLPIMISSIGCLKAEKLQMFCIFIGLLFKLDGLTPSLFIFPNGQGYFNSYLHNSLK